MLTLSNFVKKYCGAGYRIVSTGDLTEMQIAEAKGEARFYVNEQGFGYVALPWELTTDKDEERFRAKLKQQCKVPVDVPYFTELLEEVKAGLEWYIDQPTSCANDEDDRVIAKLEATLKALKEGKSRPPVE